MCRKMSHGLYTGTFLKGSPTAFMTVLGRADDHVIQISLVEATILGTLTIKAVDPNEHHISQEQCL